MDKIEASGSYSSELNNSSSEISNKSKEGYLKNTIQDILQSSLNQSNATSLSIDEAIQKIESLKSMQIDSSIEKKIQKILDLLKHPNTSHLHSVSQIKEWVNTIFSAQISSSINDNYFKKEKFQSNSYQEKKVSKLDPTHASTLNYKNNSQSSIEFLI